MQHDCEWRFGMVYAMSNATENQVTALAYDCEGILSFEQQIATGGVGSGEAIIDPLGSQGALLLSSSGRFLFAVNAGSNSISSFSIGEHGILTLIGVVPSGGIRPVSLATHGTLLYVANAGNVISPSNVTGFTIAGDGSLLMIPGSTRQLSLDSAQPACVIFSKDGAALLVTERNTNLIAGFRVLAGGLLVGPVFSLSNGALPFGAAFLSDRVLVVTEAGPNALSSYRVDDSGALFLIDGSVPNNQSATCWVVSGEHGRTAYTSNSGNNTLTYYRAVSTGDLLVIDSVPSNPSGLASPIDAGLSGNERFLYVLNGNEASISVFRVDCQGRLWRIQIFTETRLPTIGAQGLAVL